MFHLEAYPKSTLQDSCISEEQKLLHSNSQLVSDMVDIMLIFSVDHAFGCFLFIHSSSFTFRACNLDNSFLSWGDSSPDCRKLSKDLSVCENVLYV